MKEETRNRYDRQIEEFKELYAIDEEELHTLLINMYVVRRIAKTDIAHSIGLSIGLVNYMLKERFRIVGDGGIGEASIAYNYNIDIDEVYDLLSKAKELGLTYNSICTTADITNNTLNLLYKKYELGRDTNVKSKAQAILNKYSDEWYREMHVNRGFSPAKIGEMLELNDRTVRNHLEHLGIFTARDKQGYNIHGYKVSKEWLHRLYVTESKSRQYIADLLGVKNDTVTEYLKRNGISRKNKQKADE